MEVYKGQRYKPCYAHKCKPSDFIWLPARAFGVCPECVGEGGFAQEISHELHLLRVAEPVQELHASFKKREKGMKKMTSRDKRIKVRSK